MDHKIAVFKAKDLPVVPDKDEFSVYDGIVVAWDIDYDTRIISFIDSLSLNIKKELAICEEHEGALFLGWKTYIPEGYKEGQNEFNVEGDIWTVQESTVCKGLKLL